MKSKYIFASLGFMALALASCTADEAIRAIKENDYISYSVNAANQTRAAHSYCGLNMPPHFNVWADYTDASNSTKLYFADDKISRISVTNGTGEYKSETLRYWPDEELSMNFYAYVDDQGSFNYNRTGQSQFANFEVKGTVGDQSDLMYAVTKGVSTTSHDAVALNFRHALSQICFKAQNQNPNIKIKIHSVSVHNLYDTGTFTLPDASTSENYKHHGDAVENLVEKTGFDKTEFEAGVGSWSLTGNANAEYSITFDKGKELSTPLKSEEQPTTTDNLTCPTGVADTDFTDVMILMPQTRNAAVAQTTGAPTGGVYFSVNLSIDNVADGVETSVVTAKDYYAPAYIEWEPGYRYIYTFRFPRKWDYKEATTLEYDVTADDFIPSEGDLDDSESVTQLPDVTSYKEITMREATDDEPAIIFADRNVGAFTPGESGLYFWWGDITGFKVIDNKIYQYGETSTTTFSFDEKNANILTYNKSIDDLTNISWLENGNLKSSQDENNRDAATKYMGEGWRMPTIKEIYWLTNRDENGNKIASEDNYNCTWEFLKDGSTIIGAKVTSKSTNKSIELPFTGYLEKNGLTGTNGGRYWSSTPSTNSNAYGTNIQSKDNFTEGTNDFIQFKETIDKKEKCLNTEVKGFGKYNGFMIRAVKKSAKELNAENIGDNVGTE